MTGPCVVSKSIEELVEGKVEDGMGFRGSILSVWVLQRCTATGDMTLAPKKQAVARNQNNMICFDCLGQLII